MENAVHGNAFDWYHAAFPPSTKHVVGLKHASNKRLFVK
jgi:hypothetical protein